MACLDEVEGSDARALVWRAEGEVFTGGVDVNVFQRVVEILESGSANAEAAGFGQLLGGRQANRGASDPDARPGPRALPDRRPGGLAGLRHDLGDRVGTLRPRRGRRGADAGRRWDAADGRAGRACPRAGVRDERRDLRRGDAGALERRQPGRARTTSWARRGWRSPTGSPTGRRRPTAQPSGSSAPICAAGWRRPTRVTPEVAGALFATEDLQSAVRSFRPGRTGQGDIQGRSRRSRYPLARVWAKKRRSRWRARSPRPCPTRCSASSSTTTTRSSVTSRARCAATTSASCPGDRVKIELSPYDLDRGRITYRYK